ncbi:selenide, water dikinase SelD, partial [archaeon]|nr:selenide, water dikinase SelD [archaeon]
GVYRISDDTALILTLDFFTPVVDDPYLFGQIAVTNALSDVYAMGGKPLLAMNIINFPQDGDISILKDILKGGFDKMVEAGVLLVGGHSVDDPEIKYGLSVTGFIHPAKILRNSSAVPGDRLILTKPLGTGIISTAIKADMASLEAVKKVERSMNTLNKVPAEIMGRFDVHACTDVTGFGLLGHACEMIEEGSSGIEISFSKVPVFHEAFEYAKMGLIPKGSYRNEKFRKELVITEEDMGDAMKILFDPQTSGGLLIAVSGRESGRLLDELRSNGIEDAVDIGEVTEKHPGKIVVNR